MDWPQQGMGYYPYNQPQYPYPGLDMGGDNTGYVEFGEDDDDSGMYEPEEDIEPVVQPANTVNPPPGLDGASSQSEPKPKSRPPNPVAAAELAALREKLLTQRKSNTPMAEPRAARAPAPSTQSSRVSMDVDNFIAEERAAAEAVDAKNTPNKLVTKIESNGTPKNNVTPKNNGTPNKAKSANPKQLKSTTNTAQGRATPVPASSMKNSGGQLANKNHEATGPKAPQKTQQAQLTKQTPLSQSSIEPGEIMEPNVGSNAGPPPEKEIAKPIRPREDSNAETPRTPQTAQQVRRDSNTDNLRDRQEPTATLPWQNNPRLQLNRNITRPDSAQKPSQAAKANGERSTAVLNANATNCEPTASTKQQQKDKYNEQATQGERQPEVAARKTSALQARNPISQIDGRNATQCQRTQNAPNNAVVLSASRTDADAEYEIKRYAAEPNSLNAASYSRYFNDLDEWLEATGYHDQQYRQKMLSRHRALAEIDREVERIEREYPIDTDDNAYLARPGPLRAPSRRATVGRITSASSMGPPPLPSLNPHARTFEDASSYRATQSQPKRGLSPSAPDSLRPDKQARHAAVAGAQRQLDEHTDLILRSTGIEKGPPSPHSVGHGGTGFHIRGVMDEEDIHRSSQFRPQSSRARLERSPSPLRISLRRTSYQDDRARRDEDDREFIPSRSNTYQSRRGPDSREPSPPRTHYIRARSPVEYQRNDIHTYRPGTSNDAYDAPLTHQNERVRERGHGRGGLGGRGGRPRSPVRGEFDRDRPVERALNLQAGGARYFMIKSWNHENVQTAQREGVWATQPHNEELLARAFKACRHVILVFSVNKSMAFQGYARMESAPGNAPTPSWTKTLLWPTSGPFYIRWITIADVRFSRVGHLKNSLNEGLAVLVGRDGQEIEEECGRLLCESIDDVGAMRQEDEQGAR